MTSSHINNGALVTGRLTPWNIGPDSADARNWERSRELVASLWIKDHPSYPEGIVFTPYREHDVEYHLESTPINKRLGVYRVEFIGYNPFGVSQKGPIESGIDTYQQFFRGTPSLVITATPRVERILGVTQQAFQA